METYLTIAELAEYLKLSEQTIRRYVLNRTVPYHKIQKVVRFRVSEIERWVDGGGLDGRVPVGPEDEGQGELCFLPAGEGLTEAGGEAGGTEEGGEAAEVEPADDDGEDTGGAA
jgi:excisionase family DNA binding protein